MSTDGHTFAYPATDEAARIAAEEAARLAAEAEAQRQAATADTSSIGSAISDIAWGTLEVVGEVGGAVLEIVAGLAE